MTVSISVSASRTSGKLPLGVVFDASATTATGVSRPFHELFFLWDFGDTGAGTYAYGNSYVNSKNSAIGPVATHIYYAAGTYTVTCKVCDINGNYAIHSSTTITVTDWANADTICVQNGGDSSFTTADSLFPGCSHVTTSSWNTIINTHVASNKRILVFADDVFTGTGPTVPNVSSVYIGTYPIDGNKGIIKCSTASGAAATQIDNGSDIRFVDLEFDLESKANIAFAPSVSNFTNILFARMHIHDGGGGIEWALEYQSALTDGFFIFDSVFERFTNGGSPGTHALLLGSKNVGISGNKFDDSTLTSQHLLRMQFLWIAAFTNNLVSNGASTKEMIAWRSPPSEGEIYIPEVSGADAETRYGVCSFNQIDCDQYAGIKVGPIAPTNIWGMHDCLFEGNLFNMVATGDSNVVVIAGAASTSTGPRDLTFRNNISIGWSGEDSPYKVEGGAAVAPSGVDTYNNSIHNTTTNFATDCGIRYISGSGNIANNLLHVPGTTATSPVAVSGSGATIGRNSTGGSSGEMKAKNPWTTNPPTTAAHCILPASNTGNNPNYAIASGDESVPVRIDYRGLYRNLSNMDLGAMADTLGSDPFPSVSSPMFRGS
jgi:hypothetical protein